MTQGSICHVVRSKLIEVIVQIWISAYTFAKFKIFGLSPFAPAVDEYSFSWFCTSFFVTHEY